MSLDAAGDEVVAEGDGAAHAVFADVEEESLTVQARAGDRLTFPFRFGKNWKVADGETGPERFIYRTSSVHDDFVCDTFVVTVGSETASWTFRDHEGHRVELTIEIVQ